MPIFRKYSFFTSHCYLSMPEIKIYILYLKFQIIKEIHCWIRSFWTNVTWLKWSLWTYLSITYNICKIKNGFLRVFLYRNGRNKTLTFRKVASNNIQIIPIMGIKLKMQQKCEEATNIYISSSKWDNKKVQKIQHSKHLLKDGHRCHWRMLFSLHPFFF